MKNNILIIAGVTIVALGVIVAVILASVMNSGEQYSDSESESRGGSVVVSQSPETSEAPSDSTSEDDPFSESSYPYETSDDSSDSGAEEVLGIVAMANSLIGVPFLENGSDPDGFDNSGFIYYVLRENGYITCPRGTEAQSGMGTRLDYDSVKEGDLVFFRNEGSDEANFGGIYVGGGKMIACLMPGTLVREVDITTDYYRDNFFCGVSLS